MRRTVVKHEVVGRLAARVMRRGIDGLESPVRRNAAHASERCRESTACWRNAEHGVERVGEYDAMQASPEIDALVCRAEKGRTREHIEPCAQAFQDDNVASIGERAARRPAEE